MTDAPPTTPISVVPAAPPVTQIVPQTVNTSPGTVTTMPLAITPPPAVSTTVSAWDHVSLLLGAAVLVLAAIINVFHPLAATDWTLFGLAAASLGVKGLPTVLP